MFNSTDLKKSQNSIVPQQKVKFLVRLNQQKYVLLLLLPALIWYVVFKYLPMIGSYLAFTDYGFSANINFVGLANFQRLFISPSFWRALKNTLVISGYYLLFYFPLPIILALLLNEFTSIRFKRIIQFIVYIPHFFSWVVVGGFFIMFLSPTSGVVNEIVKSFGHEPIFFMVNPHWFRTVVLLASHIWKDVGYGAVIFIATLSTVDLELYDAAWVDGAGYWGRLWHITLPCLRSTIATVLLLQISNILRIFEQVLVMYNPAVYDVADVLSTFSFTEGLQNGDIGFATAIGLFTSVTSLFLIFGTNYLSKKVIKESIL